jgi:hypothetical protein
MWDTRGTRARALAAIGGLACLLAITPAARADDGLETAGASRYVVDAKRETVRARVTLTLRNTTPSRSTASGVVFYYYDNYVVPVPAGAKNLEARSAGRELDVSLKRTDDPSTRLARISFPRLTYRESRSIVISFEVPGAGPRAEDGTRVGPGYATFAVYGLGDTGRNTVEVVAPTSMMFDSNRDGFATRTAGSTAVHAMTDVDDGGGSWAVVSLRDSAQAAKRQVSVSRTDLLLVGYPDDATWLDFTAEKVQSGIPALEKLVGVPWPGGLQRIREDPTPSVRGYDGWFDPDGDEIVVGESLDDDLLLHELSHAWVNSDRFAGRWMYEGLAQVLAERAVRATGGDVAKRRAVSPRSKSAVPLVAWGGSADERSQDVDDYGYPASLAAMSDLLAEVPDDRLATVLRAAVSGESAYDQLGTRFGDRISWQELLDLVEVRGGNRDAADVYRTWVLGPDDAAQLTSRAAARARYTEIDAADGAWLPPRGLRAAMTNWDFERARALDAAIARLGAAASRTQEAARVSGIEVPDVVRKAYEDADSEGEYRALPTTLSRSSSALVAVGGARHVASAERDPLSALGADLLGVSDLASDAELLLASGDIRGSAGCAASALDRSRFALPAGAGAMLLVPVLLAVLLALCLMAWRLGREVWRGPLTCTGRV